MRAGWLGPLLIAALTLYALVLALTPPALHVPADIARTRYVTDARGVRVPLHEPFSGAAIYPGIVLPDFLLVTRDPHALLNTFAFLYRSTTSVLLDKIYPELPRVPVALYGRATSVETMLLQKPGAVLTWTFVAGRLDAVGLPAVGVATASEHDAMERIWLYAELCTNRSVTPNWSVPIRPDLLILPLSCNRTGSKTRNASSC